MKSIDWVCYIVNKRNALAKTRQSFRNKRRRYTTMSISDRCRNEYAMKQIVDQMKLLSKETTKELRAVLRSHRARLVSDYNGGYSSISVGYDYINNNGVAYFKTSITYSDIQKKAEAYEANKLIEQYILDVGGS